MRSRKVTLSVPNRLWDVFKTHAKEVGYNDPKQLLIWCAFYSLLVRRPHVISAPIALASLDVQDDIIEEVVSGYERGEIKKGSFFEKVFSELCTKLGIDLPREAIDALIAETVRKRPRKTQS